MKLPFKIAFRFLMSSRGQTILIALGIAVGVSVQIFIGSLISGLQLSLLDKTIGSSPHITITSEKKGEPIENYSKLLEDIQGEDERIINLNTTAEGAALLRQEEESYSVLVRGIDDVSSDNIYSFQEKLYEGTLPKEDGEIIIGKELQENLGAELGEEIELYTNSGETAKLKITGFYDLKVASLNESWLISNLPTSQSLFNYDQGITSIEMQLTEEFAADEIAKSLEASLPEGLAITNWKAENESLLSGLNGQNISSIMIQAFVLISVVLGIASVLAITVMQKSKQLGILKAMGIKDRSASLIFLMEGFLLGVMGTLLGIGLGLLLSFLFTKFALNPDGTPIIELYIDYGFIGISALIALASAVIASLIPARRSSKLNPIEVIQNG
ncbi:MAG: ABC transporter permease [Clostridiaceae bacterium]